MADSKRFKSISTQGNSVTNNLFEVIVDTKTGVNYLYVKNGTSGGVTPIYDKNGNILITND